MTATDGPLVHLDRLPDGRTVLYTYPRTGGPDGFVPDGWDQIPGARGCTPEACGFRDHSRRPARRGRDGVYGLSTQPTSYQREAVDRLHLPFAMLSDEDLALTGAAAAHVRGGRDVLLAD